MRIFFTLLAVFIYGITIAQNVNFKWAKQMGGTDGDGANSVAVDSKGNVYTTGTFIDTADFDPGSAYYPLVGPPYLNRGCFISKLDSSGNFVWAKQFVGRCQGISLVLDVNANMYISGSPQDTVDVDPGIGTYKLYGSSFIVKLDSSGNFIWAVYTAGTGAIVLDRACNIYTGYARYDSSGHLLRKTTMPTSFNYFDIDDSANIYYTGFFDGQVDFDPSANNYILNSTKDKYGQSTRDIYVLKIDSAGNFQWVKQIGGTYDNDQGGSITLDKQNNIYFMGQFGDTVDFDPSSSIYSLTGDMFVAKLNSSGDLAWAKSYKGNFHMKAIKTDRFNNAYFTGNFSGLVDFDPDTGINHIYTGNTSGYSFISKLDSLGNFVWVKTYYANSNAINLDDKGNVYTTGDFYAGDFDPGIDTFNMTSVGGTDIYVHKMSPCSPSSATINITACDGYTIKYTKYTSTGTYYETITNRAGCDSIITLNLTIKQSSGITLNQTSCNSYNFKNNTLTQSGIYYDTLTNAIGCDSVVTLNLTINSSSSSTIYDQGCNRYYLNKKLLTASGTYYDTIQNVVGCDSIITLHLTINKSSVTTLTKSDCKSYVFNGDTLTKSGMYSALLTNAVGCDSVVVLYLTIYNSNNINTIYVTSCDSHIFKGKAIVNSGVYYDTIPVSGACDSIIVLNLTINKRVSTSISIVSCNNYIFDGTLLTTSGFYYDTLLTSNGCDSIIKLNLKINVVDASVTQNGKILIANATNATYQWLDCSGKGYVLIPNEVNKSFIPNISGGYAVAIMQNNCYDTSNCYTVTIAGISDKNILYTFDVFPNPTNGQFTVRSSQTLRNASIKLYNITGQLVLQKTNLSGESFVLDISEQANGIYMMVIGEGLNVSRVRVIKQ